MALSPGHPLTRYEAGLSRCGAVSRAARRAVAQRRFRAGWGVPARVRPGRGAAPVEIIGRRVRGRPRRPSATRRVGFAGGTRHAREAEASETSEGILGGVGSLAVIPTWVAPPAQQIVDCFRICYAGSGRDAVVPEGRARRRAVNWVTAGQVSPISELTEQPVPEHEARVAPDS